MILVSLYVARKLGDWLINNVVHKIRYKGYLLCFFFGGGGQSSV